MDSFLIGDVLINWRCEGYRLTPGEYMEKFRHHGVWDGETITLQGSIHPLKSLTQYPKVGENYLYDVYNVDGERMHLYNWSYVRGGYAIWPDRVAAGRTDGIWFDPVMNYQIPMDHDWFFGVCGLHKALLFKNRPILHAACVEINGKAVLFTAPSETGKSTQADLWQAHAGARVVNGDRVLLGQKNGIWHAYGYPCCGSSMICENFCLPIAGVAVLTQGSENRIEPLSEAAKQRSLVAGMTVYQDDLAEIDRAFSLAESICAQVGVVRLVCRPDAQAVQVLHDHWKGEGRL
ncbi:MAG: hypothetical protein IJB17_04885 [Oscillospiraceae bacterium]|nr:hypothetical protein [Oscillospiraceae bacterium]